MYLISRPDTHILERTTTEDMARTVAEEKSAGGQEVIIWLHWLEMDEDVKIATYFNGCEW